MRGLLEKWIFSSINAPYKWGGASIIEGIDCSGLAQEFLKAFNAHPDYKIDYNAQALYDFFSKDTNAKANINDIGALAFYGVSKKSITHVSILLNDHLIFEAGGGGSKTNTLSDAISQGAYTRIRPLSHRKDLQAVLMPMNILKLL